MIYPTAKTVADRLQRVWETETLGLESRGLRLSKAVFNKLVGRRQIEESFLKRVDTQLKKFDLRVFRIGQTFAVVNASALDVWAEPSKDSIELGLALPKGTKNSVLTVGKRKLSK